MKILFVSPYVPVPPTFGGSLRIYHLMKQAMKRHEVSLVAYGNSQDYDLLRKGFGNSLKEIFLVPNPWLNKFRRAGQFYALWTRHSFFYHITHSRRMQKMLDAVLEKNHYDIIQSEFSVMGAFNFNTSGVKILDAHNVEYDNFHRMSLNAHSWLLRNHYSRECKRFFEEEIISCKKQDALFVTSLRDKKIFDKDIPLVPKYVIPNGVDTSYFTPAIIPPMNANIVFTGMMGYVPNYDGMVFFLDEIFPRIKAKIPNAKIYIVGKNPPKVLSCREADDVILTGYVADVRPFVWCSSVYVVPLRMGGGTRLKVLEAMAMKIPIVSTTIGCEGIEVHDGDTILIRDQPESFADAVIELFANNALRRSLTAGGYEKVKSTYEWSIIGDEIERWYRTFAVRMKNTNNFSGKDQPNIKSEAAVEFASS